MPRATPRRPTPAARAGCARASAATGAAPSAAWSCEAGRPLTERKGPGNLSPGPSTRGPMRSRRATPFGCILALLLLFPGFTPAQERDPKELPPELQEPVAPIAPLPPGVETIEVIGEQESGADVQDKAQAITAFSADDLERANIVNIDSLAIGVPGLHVGQSGQEAIVTLRGIGTENASITGEPGVAFHVDGVNYAQPAAARVAFFDLETLDVKLGPQGLMGGKNSTSGKIGRAHV